MNFSHFSRKIFTMIGENDIRGAVLELQRLLENTPKYKEIYILSAQYNELMQKNRMGTISAIDSDLVQNKIRYAILDLLEEIDTDLKNDKALQNLIERNKKEVIQHHYGTGDNVAGDKVINGE